MRSIPRPTGLLVTILALSAACDDRGEAPTAPGDGDTSGLQPFRAAETCGACHPKHLEEWERSMHAFAGSDPIMLALSEMATREAGEAAGGECLDCHAPALRRQEKWLAGLPPEASPLVEDLTEDGISCDFCHSIQIVPPVADIGWFDSIDPDAPKLGGIEDPVANDVHESAYDTSYRTSVQCRSCHQIFLDNDIGIENTHREWESANAAGMGLECQDCHMPRYDGPAAEGGPVRNVHRHVFVGVDYATTEFRGIDRGRQLQEIRELLEESAIVRPEIPDWAAAGGTLDLALTVRSLAGHSLPSGTSFSRDMWIEVVVRGGGGAVIYRSGWLEGNGDLVAPGDDPDLVRFGSTLFDGAGDPTFFTWRARNIDESELLPAGGQRRATYTVDVPDTTTGALTVDVALRFRPMKPEIVRLAGLDELLPITIFDMWRTTATVGVRRTGMRADRP